MYSALKVDATLRLYLTVVVESMNNAQVEVVTLLNHLNEVLLLQVDDGEDPSGCCARSEVCRHLDPSTVPIP